MQLVKYPVFLVKKLDFFYEIPYDFNTFHL